MVWVTLIIVALMITMVIAIVAEHRFEIEKQLKEKCGIDRSWWIPPLTVIICLLASFFSYDLVYTVFLQKIDIILLIFSFGILGEGLEKSNFFKYISYTIVKKYDTNTVELFLLLFMVISAITLFTTNDIVVLVVTPIIISICIQSGIDNMKPILLAQFVAANTLSMGLLIGSPTNIIISEEMSIGFFEYFIIMIIPALIAFLASLLILWGVLRIAQNQNTTFLNGLQVKQEYDKLGENSNLNFTRQMLHWVVMFLIFVSLVAIVTYTQSSLLWCAIPSIVFALVYWIYSPKHTEGIQGPVKRLPYGVLFFGISFFILTESIARTDFTTNFIIPLIQNTISNQPFLSVFGTFISGILVNIFNDLPAAALVASLLENITFESTATYIIVIQSALIGLNIGAYVTKAGALAGIIWFNRIRTSVQKQQECNRDDLCIPTRKDLLKYGVLNFPIVSTVLSCFLTIEWFVLQIIF